ncbi:MAG: hypothetical protein LBG77_01185 [Dysgonamonadaceae bacterium]|jgi:hypothetical protein|nr:hypothetical protein [Dysgonamonadaceae bacterium]
MKTKLLPLFLVALFAVSCKDDIPPALALHTPQQEDNSIILNWEQPDISGFQYYAVMRADDGQNYQIISDIIDPASDAFRKEITTFTDKTYPIDADSLYYKIMAVGNETAVSENVLFRNKNKAQLITGVIDMYFIEETNQISIIDYDYQLRVFDLQSGQFLPNTTSINLASSGLWYLWGKYNGKTEFYNYDSDRTIYVHDAVTTQQVTQLGTPSYIWSKAYTTDNKGMLYIFRDYLYLINRATDNYTQYQSNQMYRAELYYNSIDNKLYAIDEYNYNQITIFHLNEDGSVANEELFTINGNNNVPIFVENSSLFLININGQTNVLDMNDKTYHSTGLPGMASYYITKAVLANNNIYFAHNVITYDTHKIIKLSTVDYSVAQIEVRAAPKNMFVANGYLYYLEKYQFNTYLLGKIKL